MIAVISPGKINGIVTAPASKSVMQRACALALLNNGKTVIQHPGKSNDDRAALNIIETLGAGINRAHDELVITSDGLVNFSGKLDCGESGLSFRMFASIAALSKNEIILDGAGSLLKRPMHFFDGSFPKLGVTVRSNKGFLPLTIKGPMIPGDIEVDGSMSSQYLTGLLFAFAKVATKPVVIKVQNLKSKPYIDLSLQMLSFFGYDVKQENYSAFYIQPVPPVTRDRVFQVEGDWSAAAFLLVAGAIAGNIRVKGLDLFSAQADRAIVNVLKDAGAAFSVEGSCIIVNEQQELKPFNFDATDCPDLFPPLAVLAACCKGDSVIKGTGRLAGKESDRAITLQDVFGKMGIAILLQDDEMIIKGGTGVKGKTVSSHSDHRIAMACAIAALKAGDDMIIQDCEAVDKSYPDFYLHLQMLGASVSLT